MAGGYETRTYALRLRSTADAFSGPLVVRVLPAYGAGPWLAREETTLRWLEREGYPVPHVVASCADAAILGGPFLVLTRLAGTDMLRALVPRRVWQLTPTLAALQARLHALDPGPVRVLLPGVDEILAGLRVRIEQADLAGLLPGLAWLASARPSASELVVCHGDFHPRNVLMDGERVTGVIDWSLVVLADPAFDVGSTKTVLAYAPSELPVPLAAILGAFQRHVVVRRFEAQYRRLRAVDAAAVRYYEALRAFRSFVWAGEARRLAQGVSLPHARPGPWDAPPIARRLARHFLRTSDVRLTLPDRSYPAATTL